MIKRMVISILLATVFLYPPYKENKSLEVANKPSYPPLPDHHVTEV